MTEAVAIDKIRIDGGTQPRVAINEPTVREYAEHMQGGKVLPPIDIFFDGAEYWLADGFHRYHAVKALGQPALTAVVHPGTRRDAVLFSVSANITHGLQRTNADKRKAVETLVVDEEWSKWTTAHISRLCTVSEELVLSVRRAHIPETGSENTSRKYISKHGTEATMNVEKIGRTKAKTMPDRSPVAVQKRLDRIKSMAADGYSAPQIAAALEIGEATCRSIIVREGIDLPAQRSVGRTRRHDSNRIVDQMVMDAENLIEGLNLVEYAELDRGRLSEWLRSLTQSRDKLGAFIRRLMKEQQRNGEAA